MSLLVIARQLWWINQELLEIGWGSTIDQKWLWCKGCAPPHNGKDMLLKLFKSF
jgi:hypothetical protein